MTLELNEPMFMFRCGCVSRHEGWYYSSQEGQRCVNSHLFHLVDVSREANTHRAKAVLLASDIIGIHSEMAQQLLLQVLWLNLSDDLGKTVTDADRLYSALYWIVEAYGVPGLVEVIEAARELDEYSFRDDLFWRVHIKYPWFNFVPEDPEEKLEWQVQLNVPVMYTVLENELDFDGEELPQVFVECEPTLEGRLDCLEDMYRASDLENFTQVMEYLTLLAYREPKKLGLSGGHQVTRRRIPNDAPIRLWTTKEYMESPGYREQMAVRKAIPMPGVPGGRGSWKGHGRGWQGMWRRSR